MQNHRGGPSVVCDDIIEDCTDFSHVRAPLTGELLSRLGVGENGGQRLRQFMLEGAGELSELRPSGKVCKLDTFGGERRFEPPTPLILVDERGSSAFAPSQECRANGSKSGSADLPTPKRSRFTGPGRERFTACGGIFPAGARRPVPSGAEKARKIRLTQGEKAPGRREPALLPLNPTMP
jgi:hypothetical protein